MEGCCGLRLPRVEAALAVFSPPPSRRGSGIQQECTLRSSLDTWATCTIWWGSWSMGPASYVPTHACSHIYAPFSEGESDPWLELQVGEGSPGKFVSL